MTRTRKTLAVAVAALVASGPALGQSQQETGAGNAAEAVAEGIAQECMVELRRLNDRFSRHSMTLGGRHMRSLFDAASVLANNGQKEHCMAVIDGIRTYAEQLGGAPEGDLQRLDDLHDAAERATPIEDTQNVAGSRYVDDVAISPDGEMLGEIEDVVSRDGTHYLVVGSGGFLDVGQDYRPVRLERFRRLDETVLVLDVAEETFERAPAFDIERLGLDIETWGEEVDRWWQETVRSSDAG